MKLLVTGANGLVGSHFVENYTKDEGKNTTILTPTRGELNITDPKAVEDFFQSQRPDAIVHLAAYTDVSKAEEQRNNQEAPCWVVNVEGTANLVRAASANQSYFIYISTDVVFSGSKNNPGPYAEDHPSEDNPNFLSWYGWTKREAEKLITNNLKNSAILRIANPVRADYRARLDYVRKILKLYDENKLYPMFDDQYLTLTYINEVSDTLERLLEKGVPGIYHVSSINVFTPYKLADLLIETARGKKGAVKPVSIQNFLKDKQSRYPQYGGLKVEKTQKFLNLKFKNWEEVIKILSKQLSA